MKSLTEKFKDGVCLLVIDEASMADRSPFGSTIGHLIEANVDLDNLGIILIADPAQLLPIWIIRSKNDNGKKMLARFDIWYEYL